MHEKWIAVVIGYLFGSFLTAELVARKYAGKPAAKTGETGNPGMANIMASLGFIPGILTLAGDLLKVIIAAILCRVFFPDADRILIFYAGLGATLGHDFPFWRKFRGGKGVATTSMAIALYHFPFGLLSNIAGMLVVFATKYLCIGGPVIPAVFMVIMFCTGNPEAGVLSAVLTVLSLYSHGSAIMGIQGGSTSKADVLGAIKRKLRDGGRKTSKG